MHAAVIDEDRAFRNNSRNPLLLQEYARHFGPRLYFAHNGVCYLYFISLSITHIPLYLSFSFNRMMKVTILPTFARNSLVLFYLPSDNFPLISLAALKLSPYSLHARQLIPFLGPTLHPNSRSCLRRLSSSECGRLGII